MEKRNCILNPYWKKVAVSFFAAELKDCKQILWFCEQALQEAQVYISVVSDFCNGLWCFLNSMKLYTLHLIFPSYLQNFAIANGSLFSNKIIEPIEEIWSITNFDICLLRAERNRGNVGWNVYFVRGFCCTWKHCPEHACLSSMGELQFCAVNNCCWEDHTKICFIAFWGVGSPGSVGFLS